MEKVSTESWYKGGDSNLSPDFSTTYGHYTGFNRLDGAQIGFSGFPTTGNQLGEVVTAIKQGTKVFEVSMLGMSGKGGDTDQEIPKQHFAEMRALMKLTGVKPSVHGPLFDAAGFGGQGQWKEEDRIQNERRMFNAVKQAHVLSPDKNIVVNFHTGNAGGYTKTIKADENGKPIIESVPMYDREQKRVVPVDETRYYSLDTTDEQFLKGMEDPKKGGKIYTPEKFIESQNNTAWLDSLNKIALGTQRVNESMQKLKELNVQAGSIQKTLFESGKKPEENALLIEKEKAIQKEALLASQFFSDTHATLNNAFTKAFKYGTKEQREEIRKTVKDYQNDMGKVEEEIEKIRKKSGDVGLIKLDAQSQLHNTYFQKLNAITSEKAPEIYVAGDEFALEEASKTFSNLASQSYKNYGKTAPKIIIENIFEGLGFSSAEDHIALIKKARKKFENNLMKNHKKSKKEAEKLSEKLIGANWDMGHANMMKSKGLGNDYIIEQTKKIAPYVKHVHVTDNFGFADTHLVPGMGNVPIKEVLEQLEKHGKIKEMQMIVEAGGFMGTFGKKPHGFALSAFGTGMGGAGGQGSGTWNQAVMAAGDYFGGFGTINPENHHNLYGSGFTTLPSYLGGQIAGGQSRFSGNPMS